MNHAFIARKPCGCVVAAVSTLAGPERIKEAAAEWERDGLTIEFKTDAYVRENLRHCVCDTVEQLTLLEAPDVH